MGSHAEQGRQEGPSVSQLCSVFSSLLMFCIPGSSKNLFFPEKTPKRNLCARNGALHASGDLGGLSVATSNPLHYRGEGV